MDNKLLVLIPIFNEELDVLNSVLRNLTSFDVLLINDGSLDKYDYSKLSLFDNVNIIKYNQNRGQGFALLFGLNWAFDNDYNLFATFDGDGQHDVNDLSDMISFFEISNYDIILGSRFLKNKNPGITQLRKFVLKGGIWINYLYSGLLLSDAHCGLKVFNLKFAKKLYFMNYRQAHASEFNYIIKSNDLSFCEFPVKVSYTAYSKSKGQSNLNGVLIACVLLKDWIRRSLINKTKFKSKCNRDIKNI